LWFVIFFLPIVPLRREHLRVVNAEVERAGFLSTVAAFCGVGAGWKSQIEVLGSIPQSPWRVLRTYLMGFIGVPLVTFVGPMLLLVFGTTMFLKRGAPVPEWMSGVIGVCSITIMFWTAVVIARILDRAAGRMHGAKIVGVSDRKRRRVGSAEGIRRRTRSHQDNDQ
jgi:hypothetical protein